MAKRAPLGEKPFSALDKSLISGVMAPVATAEAEQPVQREIIAPVVREVSATPLPAAERYRDNAISREEKRVPAEKPARESMFKGEKLSREKRVLLSGTEEREIERCIDRIAEAFDSPVKLSHVVRACLTVLRHSEDRILVRARESGPLTRPANGDTVALVEFEHEVAKVLSQAFRDTVPLK